jgi:hypothetical protein
MGPIDDELLSSGRRWPTHKIAQLPEKETRKEKPN